MKQGKDYDAWRLRSPDSDAADPVAAAGALLDRLIRWDKDFPPNCWNGYVGLKELDKLIAEATVLRSAPTFIAAARAHPAPAMEAEPVGCNKHAPSRIWAEPTYSDFNPGRGYDWSGGDWCDAEIGSPRVEYVRADLAHPSDAESLRAEVEKTRKQLKTARKIIAKVYGRVALVVSELADEGDRISLGSTNHADILRDLDQEWAESTILKADILTSEQEAAAFRRRAEKAEAERDAAQARVAELEAGEPWVQVGFLKEKLRQAGAECEVWKDRAMKLRLAGSDCDAALTPLPDAEVESQPAFVRSIMQRLRRFEEITEDVEGAEVDIGRKWLEFLTMLGLLDRVQRSPARWQLTDAAITALRSRPVGVTVNPLVWTGNDDTALDCEWVDSFGLYQINEDVLFIGHQTTGIEFDTLDAAKAAAQADFDARILSALTDPPPATEGSTNG